MPKGNCLLKSSYATKKEVEQLGLGHVTYDVCSARCMLYYNDDIHLEKCKFYTARQYKITQKKEKKSARP